MNENDPPAAPLPAPDGPEPAAPPPPEPAPAAAADPAAGPSARQILEALLFSADEPLALDRLRECAGLEEGAEARALLLGLREEYAAGGRAFSLEEVAGGWQLLTRPVFAPHLARLRRRPERARLTGAALETLAVIAYRQPVLRTDVEKIRGVACGEMLRTLMERDLVRVSGRAEEPGSPLLYGTTTRFLAEFGLRGLKDLPTARDLPPPPGVKVAGAP
jgi:segregation and condensation protein B